MKRQSLLLLVVGTILLLFSKPGLADTPEPTPVSTPVVKGGTYENLLNSSTPTTIPSASPTIPNLDLTGIRILFDQTHAERNYLDSGDPAPSDDRWSFTTWRNTLVANGAVVDKLQVGPVTLSNLSSYDVYVVSMPTVAFSSNEINAIRSFVSSGKGILTIGEFGSYSKYWVSNNIINQITGYYGAVLNQDNVGQPIITSQIANRQDLTQGVYTVEEWASASITGGDTVFYDPSRVKQLMITKQSVGRLGLIGDTNIWADNFSGMGVYNNGALALNTIKWLSGGISVSGQVRDSNNNPLSGVTVSMGAGGSATTDSGGNYTIGGLASGTYIIVPSKAGYVFTPATRSVTVPPSATQRNFIGSVTNRPIVSRVDPCFTGAYWPQGAFIQNRYDAYATLPSGSGFVDFSLNGNTASVPLVGGQASRSYNMGVDLQYALLGRSNSFNITSRTTAGATSSPYTFQFVGYGLPMWMPGASMFQATFGQDCPRGPLTFQSEWNWEFPIHGTYTPPGWIPFLGGNEYGLTKPQVGLELEATTEGAGAVTGFGAGGIKVAGQEINGKVSLRGEGNLKENVGLQITAASLAGEISGKLKKDWPLIDAICDAFTAGICPLKEAESLPVIGSVIKWLNERAALEGTLEPSAQLAAHFHSGDSGWRWDSLNGRLASKLTVALTVKLIEGLAASAYGGGEPSASFSLLPDPGLQEIAVKLFAGVKVRIFRLEEKYEASYDWRHQFTTQAQAGMTEGQPEIRYLNFSGWQPIPRNYITPLSEYSVFKAHDSGGRVIPVSSGLGALATQENLIVSNVFPEGNPALAANGGTAMLLWVHDDVNRPLMQGEEIFFSHYNGSSWSTPTGVTSDTLQDFAPQVAFDSGGKAVAVWQHNKVIQTSGSQLNADYTNAFEIAYAVWNGSTWSVPAYLTNDSAFDGSPNLVRGNDGVLMLLWRHNTAGELVGTAGSPDTFFYSEWNGATWSAPQMMLNNAAGVLSVTLARHNAATRAVVYSQDGDDDLTTDADQELYALNWTGTAWGSPTALTTDSLPDNKPTLMYDPSGSPRLLWLKANTLYALFGSLTGTPQSVAVDNSMAILDYAATQDNTGNLSLFWQSYAEPDVDIFYATYDQAQAVFSGVEQLTHDRSLEKSMSPVFTASGQLMMAYNETTLVTETITVSPTLTIGNVTSFGSTDLYVLSHTFGPDLSLANTDITSSPANPVPGSTAVLTAIVRNVGDLAVANPQVSFYLGEPGAGGALIGSATSSLTLAGGTTQSLSVNWSVPGSGGPFTIYAVADPADTVTEQNEANNAASMLAAVPDLLANNVEVNYGNGQLITLTAILSNTGTVPAAPVQVVFRLNDPITGTAIATGTLASLAAGDRSAVQTTWNATTLANGRYRIYAVADPANALIEANEANNDAWAGLGLLPDLALHPSAINLGVDDGGAVFVKVGVLNKGIRDAVSVPIGLYNTLPTSGTLPFASGIVSVQSGAVQTATLYLGNYLWGFYAAAGLNAGHNDRDLSDNTLLVGQLPHMIYLPIVRR